MAGTVVLTSQRTEGVVRRAVITCTADAADGSFPTATLQSLGVYIDGALLAIKTNPGATAPTDNYDIVLNDADGIDRLNAVGANRDTTTSEIVAVTGAPYFGPDEALTLTVTGNSVNSAIVVITLYWAPAVSAGTGGGGGGGAVTQSGTWAVDTYLDQIRISQTPTISAAAIYASGDAVGGLLTFASAARSSGESITVTGVVIIDKDSEVAPLELVLFDRTFTATADNAVFAPSDADLANCIGAIDVSNYKTFSTNSIGTKESRLTATLNGTSLFGQLVVRGTPTYTATDDIIVIVQVARD